MKKSPTPRNARLLAATILGLALLGVGCRDDLTRPPSGPRANFDPVPQDVYPVAIPADPWNGSGEVNGTLAVFPQPTWVKITASGPLSRSPNFDGIGGEVTLGPVGNSSVSIGASGIAIDASPKYVNVSGTWTKAQRMGYTEREYAGFPPGVYCGRAYDTRCDTWSGTTQITVARLAADLSLTPEHTTVAYGGTPYFDYRASPMTLENGQATPFTVDSTHWEPDMPTTNDPAVHASSSGACQPLYYPACRRKLFGSGTFSMSAWVNGKRLTKSVYIVVSAPTLQVTCSPAQAVRGSTVTCSASLSPAGPYVLSRQSASGANYSYLESPNASYAAGGIHPWAGPAALSTTVTMMARLPDGRVIPGRGGFSVIPRTWTPWQLTSKPDSLSEWVDGMSPTLRQPGDIVPAGYVLRHLTDSTVPAQRIASGPNTQVGFIPSLPPLRGSVVYIHPEFQPGTVWYNNQIGTRMMDPTNYCSNYRLTVLWQEVRRHEGLTMHPDSSHWGESNSFLASDHPHTKVEELAVQLPDTSTAPIRSSVALDFYDWVQGPHHAVQSAFDFGDYPVINAKINNCIFYWR